MEISKYAPVVIPTLNRYDHFKACLESLEECTYSDRTDVYIALDYPPSEKYEIGWKQIDTYLKRKEQSHSFKSLTVIRRSENYLIKRKSNVHSLIESIRVKYDRYIFSEDDNVFARGFLEYINKYLDIFKDDPTVTSISGYGYPFQLPISETGIYKTIVYSPWGVGFWYDKNYTPDERKQKVSSYMKDFRIVIKLISYYPWLFCSIVTMLRDRTWYGDQVNRFINFVEGTATVTPSGTLVRNMGFDNTGIFCKENDGGIHARQVLSDVICFDETISEVKDIHKYYKKYYNTPVFIIIKSICKYIRWRFV